VNLQTFVFLELLQCDKVTKKHNLRACYKMQEFAPDQCALNPISHSLIDTCVLDDPLAGRIGGQKTANPHKLAEAIEASRERKDDDQAKSYLDHDVHSGRGGHGDRRGHFPPDHAEA
jgi:hypothetical protein